MVSVGCRQPILLLLQLLATQVQDLVSEEEECLILDSVSQVDVSARIFPPNSVDDIFAQFLFVGVPELVRA